MTISLFNKIYRKPEMRSLLHIASSTIYLWQAQGLITRSVNIGPRAVGWPAHEIDALLAARVSGRSSVQMRALVAEMMLARNTTMLDPESSGHQEEPPKTECVIGAERSGLRARFASAALAGLIQGDISLAPKEFAARAYEIADAMLAELNE